MIPPYTEAQANTPEFLQHVYVLAYWISRAEGYGKPGARPTRNNNPGDLEDERCVNIQYASPQEGWGALFVKLTNIMLGKSSSYAPDETFESLAHKWTGNDQPMQWVNVVSIGIGIPQTKTLMDWFEMPIREN